jgi:pantetheine-phosphate adenylyltransferase
MAKQRIGLYPGTFDPVTNGHMDIIVRATSLVDKLVVAVAVNAGKGPLFGLDDRVDLLRGEIKDLPPAVAARIEIRPFRSLLMKFVEQVGATQIVRGLRAVSDFEYEFQMAGMNRRLNPTVETVFLMASESNQFIASRFVKEIARLGGDITHFVSPRVAERVRSQFVHSERDVDSDNDPTRPTIPVPDVKQPL